MPSEPSSRSNALAGLEALEAQTGQQQPGRQQPGPSRPATVRPPRGSTMQAIRTRGPLLALLPPLVLGSVAFALLRGNESTARGVAGFGLALLAAPLMPAVGVPFHTTSARYLVSIAASAVLWLVVGAIAAARATRDPQAGWGRFWAEWLWMAVCVWVGMLLALAGAAVLLS
jgi:hypothetical protein